MAAICYSRFGGTTNTTEFVVFNVTASSDYDPYLTAGLGSTSTYYVNDYTLSIPKPSRDEFAGKPRRPAWIRWERWSNQFHHPAYDVFKPVHRELPRRERLAPQRIGRVRRARLCSSSASLQPYSP